MEDFGSLTYKARSGSPLEAQFNILVNKSCNMTHNLFKTDGQTDMQAYKPTDSKTHRQTLVVAPLIGHNPLHDTDMHGYKQTDRKIHRETLVALLIGPTQLQYDSATEQQVNR